MKNLFLFLPLFVSLHFTASAQTMFQRDITFETNGQYAVIDQSQMNNIWQKGAPHKTLFTAAHSVPYAIITDTSGLYPANNLSSFSVKMEYISGCWGMGWLDFWHKYQTDSLHAGGYIDISYDTSNVFHNIIFDTVEPLMGGNSVQNFYTADDTITGNIPAFSGNSYGWVHSSVFWVWEIGVKDHGFFHDSLTIRFNFKSDGSSVPMEGWMIDDISMMLDNCTGGIDDNLRKQRVSIYPNPVGAEASIALINFTPGTYRLEILDNLGNPVTRSQTVSPPLCHFTNPGLAGGLYFYRITGKNGTSVSGKMTIVN